MYVGLTMNAFGWFLKTVGNPAGPLLAIHLYWNIRPGGPAGQLDTLIAPWKLRVTGQLATDPAAVVL